MGLLALGTPLDWQQAKGYAGHVREHGIEQFLKIWHRLKDRTGDVLLWGDEVSVIRGGLDSLMTGTTQIEGPQYGGIYAHCSSVLRTGRTSLCRRG